MPLPRSVARFNRKYTNKVLGIFAPSVPGFALVEHKGRRTGKPYSTPVCEFSRPGGHVFALTYSSKAEWVQNVLAAGECVLIRRGRRFRVTNPRVVIDSRVPWPVSTFLRLVGVHEFLEVDKG